LGLSARESWAGRGDSQLRNLRTGERAKVTGSGEAVGLLEFGDSLVGQRPEGVGLASGRACTGLCDRVSVGIEPLLEREDVRALVPELMILC